MCEGLSPGAGARQPPQPSEAHSNRHSSFSLGVLIIRRLGFLARSPVCLPRSQHSSPTPLAPQLPIAPCLLTVQG